MKNEAVLVFNIQGFSIQDGPGIRSTVFIKGCPLRCKWCANPESQSFPWDVLQTPTKCVRCYRCIGSCPNDAVSLPPNPGEGLPLFDHSICYQCTDHRCVKMCFESALEDVGKRMTPEEVFDRVSTDVPFYRNTGGGVTVSGGEPLSHPEWVRELLRLCKEDGIHTAIETTGYAPWDAFKSVLEYTDLVLFDIKAMDSAVHKAATGVGNELIHENLRRVTAETGASVIIRIPVIPGVNDSVENMEATAALAKQANVRIVHLLAYHRMGLSKYQGLGREYPLDEKIATPSSERMAELQKVFLNAGIKCGVGGNDTYI